MKNFKVIYAILAGIAVVFLTAVCIFMFARAHVELYDESGDIETYSMISMEDAKKIFETTADASYIILDVRRADEFAAGHIPGAINIANETIGSEPIAELPDKKQVIYVYCRSGNRSKQAAEKLVTLGYKNIIEFGGIIDWTGDIER